MLTLSGAGYLDNPVPEQGVSTLSAAVARVLGSIYVSADVVSADVPSEPAQPRPSRASGDKGGRRKRRKKGGWGSSTCLRWQEVKQIAHMDALARQAGRPMNVFASIRSPEGVEGAEAKRAIGRAVAHFGQALHRRGVPHIGLTVYEREPGGEVHGHHLAHVPREHDDILARWADGNERHVRPAAATDVLYMTKQREALPPHFTPTLYGKPHNRRKGAEIPGPRWTATKALCALEQQERPASVAKAPSWQFDASGQFMLFREPAEIELKGFWAGKLPASVANDVLARQKGLGLTQGELARRVGISRPQLANALAGRFGLSRQPVARLQALLAA